MINTIVPKNDRQFAAMYGVIKEISFDVLPKIKRTHALNPQHDGIRVAFKKSAEFTPHSSLRGHLTRVIDDFRHRFITTETKENSRGFRYTVEKINTDALTDQNLTEAWAEIEKLLPAVSTRLKEADRENLNYFTHKARGTFSL